MQAVAAEPDSPSHEQMPASNPVWKRPVAAAGVLLAFYLAISIFIDTRGHLSNDVGGKTASVQLMAENQTWDPGLHYWFETADPEGRFFPLGFTARTENGTWVNATTMTMLLPARGLWALGGGHAILLLPMLGAIFAALGARQLHRRLRPDDDGAISLWVVGLASPATIYALDFWEHSWGLALMLFGIVWTMDSCSKPDASRQALLAGLAFGLAATMRQEALVYGFIAGVTVTATWVRQRNWSAMIASSAKMALGAISMIAAHAILEVVLLGSSERTSRAGGTLRAAGGEVSELIIEALATTIFALPSTAIFVWVISVLLVASTGALTISVARKPPTGAIRPALIATVISWALFLGIMWTIGPAYVPGMLVAAPFATFGLAGAITQRWFLPLWLGVIGPLPIILITQFQGGAFPQWAGRYHLATAVVLLVMGLVWLRERDVVVMRAVLALSVLVSAVGVLLVVDRSNEIGDVADQIASFSTEQDIVVWRDPFNARELGQEVNQRSWLSAPHIEEQTALAQVLDAEGVNRFFWLVPDGNEGVFPGYRAAGVVARLEFFDTDVIEMVATAS